MPLQWSWALKRQCREEKTGWRTDIQISYSIRVKTMYKTQSIRITAQYVANVFAIQVYLGWEWLIWEKYLFTLFIHPTIFKCSFNAWKIFTQKWQTRDSLVFFIYEK